MNKTASYRETIDWLFGLQKFGIKLGLDSITRLLALLENPHQKLRCIHIAGTNGKGSTAAYLHSIYTCAGYRPGLYTSPHLVDFTERIIVGDAQISHNKVIELVQQLRGVCKDNNLEHITFFEFVTALAIKYFAQQNADPVILETGMGGRLDATNVVEPLLTIITSISREHTAHLGPTLMHIAKEKAGIIKQGCPCVSGVTRSGPRDAIRHTCRQKGSELLEYGRDFKIRSSSDGYTYYGHKQNHTQVRPGLTGFHQARNAALAITAVDFLRTNGYSVEDSNVRDGIESCFWPGRFETVQRSPHHIVLDGAHNPAAWQALIRTLRNYKSNNGNLVLILGSMRDKNMHSLAKLASQADICIFFKPNIDRSAGRDYLEKYIVFSQEKRVFWSESIAESLAFAYAKTGPQDLICITGSLFAVGEARELLSNKTTDLSGRIGL